MRLATLSAVGLCACAAVSAQGQDPFYGPSAGSNYVRVALGTASVLQPTGEYQEFTRPAYALSLAYEGWDVSRDGQERQGVAFAMQYARMPVDATYFSQTFLTAGNDHPTQASGNGAFYTFEIEILRRFPNAFVTPNWHLGFGLFDLPNSTVHYQSPSTTGSAQLLSRYGPLVSTGLGLDRSLGGRVSVFVEGRYTLAFDVSTYNTYVQGVNGSTTTINPCNAGNCPGIGGNRVTQIADFRAGVRVHVH